MYSFKIKSIVVRHLCLLCVLIIVSSELAAQSSHQIILFNDNWKFYKDDLPNAERPSLNDKDWRTVNLPHDWSIEGPFDEQWASATGYLPGGIGWYRKTFTLAPALRSKHVFIYFDGVYKNSEVWINGHYLGKRPNGFIPFQYEITDWLNKTGTNTIAVKCDHTDFGDARWYTGSGIYRNVYLVATESVYVDLWGIRFTTPQVSATKASAKIEVNFVNRSNNLTATQVDVRLVNSQGQTIATAKQELKIRANHRGQAKLALTVNNPALWSTNHPQLYTLRVSLAVKGKKTDEVTEEVGFRSFRFDKDKGFFLNNENMKLKGVCLHDDAGALGVAVPEDVWRRRLQLLKDAGCNSIRMSHNPHADYLYHLADRMGFLVIDEAFDEWELGKNKWIKGWNVGQPGKDGYHSNFAEWAERDLSDMVLRNINHPSIIMWSIGNEIDYPNDPYTHEVLNTGRNPQIYGRGYMSDHPSANRLGELAKLLTAVVKKYDTTRPVTAALAGVVMSNEVGYPETLDVVGYNYQEYRYAEDHKKYPERIIYGSENGHQYANWKAVEENEFISGQYLWTGIDYLGEARSWPSRSNGAGLLDLAGFPKSEYYFRKSLWTEEPMTYLATSATSDRNQRNMLPVWNYNPGDSVRINCFTNNDEAELFLNGASLGKKKRADANNNIISWLTVYQPGELLVRTSRNGGVVNQESIKTTSEPYAIHAELDMPRIKDNGVAHIEIRFRDKDDNYVYKADNEVEVSIEGPAKLIGLESGNLNSHEDYKASRRKAFNGRLLAYVQARGKPGVVRVHLTSPGLKEKIIELRVW